MKLGTGPSFKTRCCAPLLGMRAGRSDFRLAHAHVSRTSLKDADGRLVAEQWLVEGGGHAWFGGDPRGSFTQTVGLDASRVMVRFFLAQELATA
jgi:poly(3-hydroxybutyrate) depolymerase